jgi:predicted acyl esterase
MVMPLDFADRTRRPLNSPEYRGARPRRYSRTVEAGMLVERDIRVPTRFGYDIFIDLFRPIEQAAPVPPLIAWTPYGKHDPAPIGKIYPTSGVQIEWMSDYTIFEAPDPVYWVGQGYAVITADIPGTWNATTIAYFLDPREAEAYYDLIEWAGVQLWSNGKVGLSGVSYLTSSQWRVAELKPPHLAAINPWEGWSDTYNEIVRHGGIPETHFWPYIQVRWGASDTRIEDLWAQTAEHPFFDDYWRTKAACLEQIEVPAFVVASWSDHGVHTRGTLEGFKRIASHQKWLLVHGEKKWAHYYKPQSIVLQTAFFDHFLKDVPDAIADWPAVRYQLRDRHAAAEERAAAQWPIEGTRYERLYLDAAAGALAPQPPQEVSSVTYDSLDEDGLAQFDYRFASDVEIVGHMKLAIEVSADEADDLDLFVVVEKLDVAGVKVGFTHYAVFEDGPVAFGWLRVSRRELDPVRSSVFQPVLANARDLKLAPGEPVRAEIEILPSGTRFAAGETLRLIVKGRDIYYYPKPMLYMHHEDTVNRGVHRLHSGGTDPSHLLIPIVAGRI